MPTTPLRTALTRLRGMWRSLGCSPAEQLALGVLVAGALAALAVLWWAQRPGDATVSDQPSVTVVSSPPATQPPAAGRTATGGAGGPEGARGQLAATPAPSITVHVTGRVAAPGVYDVPQGARVVDALDAAGGPVEPAAVDRLNLAAPLSDGAQIRVPRPGETPPAGGLLLPATGQAGAPEITPVDLNTADRATLETIPGVGPVTADRILAHREEVGGFTAVEDLLDIRGIGPATVEELRDAVVVR